jgi:glycosyltransferase involved in cell wall biosynthesis
VIGAVVPVYNRRNNLELLLQSLECQTMTNFHVVVADDGSTDGTRELVEKLAAESVWGGRLRWVGCGPNLGVRTGRARNIGAANLNDQTRLLVMLDSDLILQPTAMAQFADAHGRHPGSVLLGLVEWLPSLSRDAVRRALAGDALDGLRQKVPRGQPVRVEGTFTGVELRAGLYDADPDQPLALRPEWSLPLNSGWPLDLYWRIGGFDEAMRGYGYKDMEFGARAAKAGARCVAQPELWALHVWHPKPPKSMTENQRNLDYFLRRHGPNQLIEVDVDWKLWWHYHAERNGTVVSDGQSLWAVNAARDSRLRLPNSSWIGILGHCDHAVPQVGAADLAMITDRGTAYDPDTSR